MHDKNFAKKLPYGCSFKAFENIWNLYCGRPEIWNLDRAKTPRFNDRKRVYILILTRLRSLNPGSFRVGPNPRFRPTAV
jgi:hypothetical protein